MGKKKEIKRPFKLSATALALFLKSPKAFYWRYINRLESIAPSVATYDHDKLCGVIWAEFVDRFYKHVSEKKNKTQTLTDWDEKTSDWVPPKAKDRLTAALESWSSAYYQMFSPDDGVRNGSELNLENDRFVAYLDGLSSEGVVHEVKSTSRSPNIMGQLWKVQNSIQVKLYCVMARANGVLIEFAYKDQPYAIFRGPVLPITNEQLEGWEQELNGLADYIYSLGDDINNYPCNPDGCCLVTKNITSMCIYSPLCEKLEGAEILYKEKEKRRK